MALACRRLASAALSAVRSEALAAVPRLGFSALAEPTAQTLRSDENYAAVMYGANDLRFGPHPVQLPPAPEPNKVRIRMRAVGICGSDIHFLQHGRIGKFVVEDNMVLGHESAGEVVSLGSTVTNLQVGDRVALEPGVPCFANMLPRQGRYNLCPDMRFFATPPIHGSLTTFVDHPSDFCFKLPDSVTFEGGAMAEPLSNGINACQRGHVTPGKKVAILGAGPVGLITAVAAKGFGASRIAITDIREDNLPIAKALGADHTLLTNRNMTAMDIAQMLKKALPPFGPEVVIDCAGFDSTLQTAVEAVASGGKVVLVGMGQDKCTLNTGTTLVKELDLHGCFRYTNTYPIALDWLERKQVDIEPFITHRFGFDEKSIVEGFECAANPDRTKCIKAMFELPGQ